MLDRAKARVAKLGRGIRGRLYTPPSDVIAGNDFSAWPSAGQPVRPIGPPGSQPLAIPFWYGQNLQYAPRPDAELTATDLRRLGTYPLARILIENVKDQICQADLIVQLRQRPGESSEDVKARRKTQQKGSRTIYHLYKFLEKPDGIHDWSTWLRSVIEDMLVLDAASVLVRRRNDQTIADFQHVPGDTICRYIDDGGYTPMPPSPAYAQLWEGIPRVNLTTDQLLYRPRNIVPRNTISSHLYGYSPVEQLAEDIEIGWARLKFVMAYYSSGSMPNFLHVVPGRVTADKIKENMDLVNADMSGQFDQRRMYRMIQGFTPDGKDQVIFPPEPVLADVFDDLHIRRVCYGFGSSPQRLMRMMNRASAQQAQQSAENEGLRPFLKWACKEIGNPLTEMLTLTRDYEIDIRLNKESDEMEDAKIGDILVKGGRRTINEDRVARGEDRLDDPAADQLAVTTTNGRVPIGIIPQKPGPVQRGEK